MRPLAEGGCGLDALWNDDFHHSAMVALTGRAEAYYTDTRGEPQEFISAVKYGCLFQGQYYHWQQQSPRHAGAGICRRPRSSIFLQNHDQVANTARGLRGDRLTSPGRWRAMTALLLLSPGTPMLFQGQEFAASAPFLYFADFEPELAAAVRNGRGEFLRQFPSIVDLVDRNVLADPGDPATFARCTLDLDERATHAAAYALHIDLLRLRRDDTAFGLQQPWRRRRRGARAVGVRAPLLHARSPRRPRAHRQPRARHPPPVDARSRCWRRRRMPTGPAGGRARTPCYGGSGTLSSGPTGPG